MKNNLKANIFSGKEIQLDVLYQGSIVCGLFAYMCHAKIVVMAVLH